MKTQELKALALEVGYGWAGWTVAVLSVTPFARVRGATRIPSAEGPKAVASPAPQPKVEAPVPPAAPALTRVVHLPVVSAPVISLPTWTVAPVASAEKLDPKPQKPTLLTVPALRAEAKRRGLKGYSRLCRAELVAMLAVAS